ncbi:acyl-CoA dehydrogenase [Synechococcales cyanobacterium C]|uniref:Acyl-CoA dehydrogenase n=1 Tax=Petrachloros mirabilis ULC683 TaxID=2781853 RepID=A0A8K2A0J8_9CYAN|nr:acyl-CoA dehydrogenase family protein [Petrachloros mirabilis]NCJ07358.1 acyl-CoA dehydrogenase [Petrachloros mirabilis ULC683]
MLVEPVADFLSEVEDFLWRWVAPQSIQIDQDFSVLKQVFQAMGDRNLLTLQVPQQWGGRELDMLTFRQFQERISRYSGALAFLQTQHQSAAALLAQSDNLALQQQYLPKMGTGLIGLGVGISHLRRQGLPRVQARLTDMGFSLSGQVPWVTGAGCFQHFIVGATCANGSAVLGIAPLVSTSQPEGGTLHVSHPLDLVAMASTQTVTVTLQDWHLETDAVVCLKPTGWLQGRDHQDALQHGFFALGCAQAGLDIVATQTSSLSVSSQQAIQSLQADLEDCRQHFYQAQQTSTPYPRQLHLRATAIDLAHRCAQAAVTVSRGAANRLDHPAQRVYREALAFTIFGQTPDILEATLEQLVNPGKFTRTSRPLGSFAGCQD